MLQLWSDKSADCSGMGYNFRYITPISQLPFMIQSITCLDFALFKFA